VDPGVEAGAGEFEPSSEAIKANAMPAMRSSGTPISNAISSGRRRDPG
jgi:hypothetical protein